MQVSIVLYRRSLSANQGIEQLSMQMQYYNGRSLSANQRIEQLSMHAHYDQLQQKYNCSTITTLLIFQLLRKSGNQISSIIYVKVEHFQNSANFCPRSLNKLIQPHLNSLKCPNFCNELSHFN